MSSIESSSERERQARAEAVMHRLKETAKTQRSHVNDLVPLYATERLLVRVAATAEEERLPMALKGGFLIRHLVPAGVRRSTRDADLAISSPLSVGQASDLFARAAAKPFADGVTFDPATTKVIPIREQQTGGVSVTMDGKLGRTPVRAKFDIGFGDVVVPVAQRAELPSLVKTNPSISMLAYRPETIIAEKAETAIWYGLGNVRQKDIYDLATMPQHVPVDGEDLRQALSATFSHRGTPLPLGTPATFSQRYVQDEKRLQQWEGFLRNNTDDTRMSLAEAADRAWRFLAEPTRAAAASVPFPAAWNPMTQAWTVKRS